MSAEQEERQRKLKNAREIIGNAIPTGRLCMGTQQAPSTTTLRSVLPPLSPFPSSSSSKPVRVFCLCPFLSSSLSLNRCFTCCHYVPPSTHEWLIIKCPFIFRHPQTARSVRQQRSLNIRQCRSSSVQYGQCDKTSASTRAQAGPAWQWNQDEPGRNCSQVKHTAPQETGQDRDPAGHQDRSLTGSRQSDALLD